MEWLIAHWTTMVTLLFGGGGLATLAKVGPRLIRRVALMLDCEVDRLRWEEADKLRNREIALLRQDVANLQGDIARLLARSVASGVASGAATANVPAPPPTSKPSGT